MKKSIIAIFVIIVLIALSVVLITTLSKAQNPIHNLNGILLSYQKITMTFTEEDLKKYYNMSDEDYKDLYRNRDKYVMYQIKATIKNNTNSTFYNLKAILKASYANLWLFTDSLGAIQPLDLSPGDAQDRMITIIIKVGNMSAEEIDTLIRSLKIEIISCAGELQWE